MTDWNDDDNAGDLGALGFNAEEVETPDFELVPPGRYEVDCTKALVKPSKNNPTTMLAEVEETIIGPTHAGRKIWSRYVVAHEKPDVMARGRADVARMMQAYGIGGASLTPMVGRSCIAAVDVEAAKGDFDAKNKIKRREPSQGAAKAPASAPASNKPASPKPAPGFLANRKG